MAGEEDELRTSDGVPVYKLLDVNPEPEEEDDIARLGQTQLSSYRQTSKTRKRALSIVTRGKVTKKVAKMRGSVTQMIAKATEGSQDELHLIRMVRRLALKQVQPRIERIGLPAVGSQRKMGFAIPDGQRGMPSVRTTSTRRAPAMCNIPAVSYVNPNAAMGDKLGTEEPDLNLTPQEAALRLRDQMIKQVKAMVKTSLLKKQRDQVYAAPAAASPVLTEVSIQEELARMDTNVQGALNAFKGLPLDDVPTGDAGHPADSIIQR